MSLNDNGHGNGWRTESMYTFGEAAQLAHVSTSTVKNWLFGYTIKGRDVPPLFSSGHGERVSFLQMIEIMVAARFRKSKVGRSVSFHAVRNAYVYAQESWGMEYPFAHLRLEPLGGHIVHFLSGRGDSASYQAMDTPEQWSLPGLVRETISQLEYDHELAARWFPVGKGIPIVVDPRISTGLPVIEKTGITVRILYKRWKAGQDIAFLARDYDLETPVVETVLRYADSTKLAA